MTTDIRFFDIVDVVGEFIQLNVQDIDPTRREKGEQWVYPTYTKKPSNLPQATIEIGDVTYEAGSAGDFLKEETLPNGDYRVYFYKKAIYPMHIFTITAKEREMEVESLGKKLFLTNKPLNSMLSNRIKNALWEDLQAPESQLLKFFEKFKIVALSTSFENNRWSWASDMTCEVHAKDVWVKEYRKGALLTSYSLNVITI